MKIEIKPTHPVCDHPEDPCGCPQTCWDVYLDGTLHFSTNMDKERIEKEMIPEWLRNLDSFKPFADWIYEK